MLITNLDEPEWITINCREKLTTDIMCYFEELKKPSPTIAYNSTLIVFNANCIIKKSICYKFYWVNGKEFLRNGYATVNTPNKFKYLFNAVSVTISPILCYGFTQKYTYEKYQNLIYFKMEEYPKHIEGFVIYKSNPIPLIVGLNLFKCGKNVFISISLICNGHNDCPGREMSDEIECKCDRKMSNMTIYKSETKGNELKLCPYFYIQTVTNSCHAYEDIYLHVMHH